MKNEENKLRTLFAIFLMLSISASMILSTPVNAVTLPMGGSLPEGTVIPSYLYLSIAPNPAGVGQTVFVNCFLGATLIDGEAPVNMSVQITFPNGNTQTQPIKADQTGGGYFNFVPASVGTYKFQGFYEGQPYATPAYVGLIEGPSQTDVVSLTVQEEQVTQRAYPLTPLPTNYWETPVSAQNTQYWYSIMGPTIFPAKYNTTTSCNPYTQSVLSGHVLWTKPWGTGGVVGGDAGHQKLLDSTGQQGNTKTNLVQSLLAANCMLNITQKPPHTQMALSA